MADTTGRGTPETVYCTITSRGYLPRALVLARSVQEHEPARRVVVLVLDVVDGQALPPVDGVEVRYWDDLGLTRREYLQMAAYYQVYELATAIKPLFIMRLLDEYGAVVFLDSDTRVFSPLDELEPLLAVHPIVLTPHIVAATETPSFVETMLLRYGSYNLGFGAFARDAVPFLRWWWSRTRLHGFAQWYKGMWCDQRWVDVGSTIFPPHLLMHPGYNVAWWNVPHRPLHLRDDGTVGVGDGDAPLRMVHFSNFHPGRPEAVLDLCVEPVTDATDRVMLGLARRYDAELADVTQGLAGDGAYRFDHDTTGRALVPSERHAYRDAVHAGKASDLPTPFQPEEAEAYARWRRSAWRHRAFHALEHAVSPPVQEQVLDRARATVARALTRRSTSPSASP